LTLLLLLLLLLLLDFCCTTCLYCVGGFVTVQFVICIKRVMLVVGSSSWLTLCTIPPPACTFIGLMTVPLMMGFFVLGSTADELTVSALEDSLQQHDVRPQQLT
jgi:formate hydrogenlyase subunit 4